MNWTGLLNWSLNQQEKDTDLSKISEMSDEDKQWVREMMQIYEVNIVEEIKKSLEYIKNLQPEDEDYEDKLLSELEVQVDLVQGIENASSKNPFYNERGHFRPWNLRQFFRFNFPTFLTNFQHLRDLEDLDNYSS